MQKKLEQLRYLLDHWGDIFDGSPSSEPFAAHSASFESREPGKMPKMASHATVRELERCLKALASASPGDYRHLQAWSFGADWRTVDCWRRVKLPSGKLDWVPDRKRERVLPKWLESRTGEIPPRVLRAELFLCRVFQGEVYIPDELKGAFFDPEAA